MGEFITPPALPPTTYCRRLLIPDSPEWIGTVTGALMDLIYPSAWKQTTGISAEEAASRAREMFNLYLNSGNNGDCGDMTCCDNIAVIYRVNPSSGRVEQSTNNGSTWTPAAGGFGSVIVEPIPPVTSGVAVNKCDATQNFADQVQVWIDEVSANFDTATTLLAFAEGVIIAIVAALTLILSAGALTPIQALVLPTIGAALTAAWAAGKAAFDAYWTTENKNLVKCAAYCNIGTDGAFTDGQFSAFWNQCNSELPPAPAKMLFMGFLSSVGRAGLNSMTSTGNNTGADCSDCFCGCDTFDFLTSDNGFAPLVNGYGTYGSWDSGQGWKSGWFPSLSSQQNLVISKGLTPIDAVVVRANFLLAVTADVQIDDGASTVLYAASLAAGSHEIEVTVGYPGLSNVRVIAGAIGVTESDYHRITFLEICEA